MAQQKRNEFPNGQAGLKKKKLHISPGQHNKDEVFKLAPADKRKIMSLT